MWFYSHKNNLRFRKVEEGDLEDLQELKSEGWWGTHTISILNYHNQVKWFDTITFDPNYLCLIVNNHVYNIGFVIISNINWINRTCEFSYSVFKDLRGNGFSKSICVASMDLVFEILNLNRINTEVLETNTASYKALVHAGYELEGTKKQAVHKCNEYVDSFCLGITKDTWSKLDRVKSLKICNNNYDPS